MTDLILDEVETELDRGVPPGLRIEVELVWSPPWTADRMSDRGSRKPQVDVERE